jgi:hypothetical protein
MSGGLPLGAFARQRRDFAHEQLVWNDGFILGGVGVEWSAQLWNNGTLGWSLEVYGLRVYSEPTIQFGVGWLNQELEPSGASSGMQARGDQPQRFGLMESAINTPLTLNSSIFLFATPAGLEYFSESPLFIIPANMGLTFDFFLTTNTISVEVLYGSSIDTSPGRRDLS